MQPPSMLDRILEIVQKIGPVLPVDVASKLGLDSFLASAFLSQLAEAGKIQVSKERIGGSQLFFVPGQENSAQEKVKALIEASKKTARTYAKNVPDNPEVQKKRSEFAAKLQEIESKEKKRQSKIVEPFATPQPGHKVIPITIQHVSQEVGPIPERAVGGLMMPRTEEQRRTEAKRTELRSESSEKPKPEIPEPEKAKVIAKEKVAEPKPEIPEVEEVHYEAPKLEPLKEEIAPPVEELKHVEKPGIRELIEKKFLKKPVPPVEAGPLVDATMAMLVDSGCEIIGTDLLKKGKDANIIFDLPTKIGNIKMLAFVRSKKSITEADLSMAYTEGVNRKMLVVFVTNGKLTKLAQNYHQVISGMLKFKTIESK